MSICMVSMLESCFRTCFATTCCARNKATFSLPQGPIISWWYLNGFDSYPTLEPCPRWAHEGRFWVGRWWFHFQILWSLTSCSKLCTFNTTTSEHGVRPVTMSKIKSWKMCLEIMIWKYVHQESIIQLTTIKYFIVYLPIHRSPLFQLPSVKFLCDSADDSGL